MWLWELFLKERLWILKFLSAHDDFSPRKYLVHGRTFFLFYLGNLARLRNRHATHVGEFQWSDKNSPSVFDSFSMTPPMCRSPLTRNDFSTCRSVIITRKFHELSPTWIILDCGDLTLFLFKTLHLNSYKLSWNLKLFIQSVRPLEKLFFYISFFGSLPITSSELVNKLSNE